MTCCFYEQLDLEGENAKINNWFSIFEIILTDAEIILKVSAEDIYIATSTYPSTCINC